MLGALLAASVLGGVLLRDMGTGWLALPVAACVSLTVLALRPGRATAVALALVLCAAGIGFWRAAPIPRLAAPEPLVTAREFSGTVQDIPRRYPGYTRVTVALDTPVSALVVAQLPRDQRVAQGDVVVLTGRFLPRPSHTQPGAVGTVVVKRARVLGNEAPAWQRLRTRLVRGIVARIERAVPRPAGPFVAGVLTGDDGGMTETTVRAFRAAGFSHLTAVSGWNVTVVGAVVAVLTGRGRLPRRWVLLVNLGAVWAFAYLVGMEPSVTRAALMATLALLALWRGRPRDVVTALAWSAALMVLIQPAIRFHAGFQLSVASTAALVAIMPRVAGGPRWLALIATPLAAQLAATPLLLHHFGQYSLVAPVGNALVAPLIPAVMAGGVAVVLASLVHPVLADAAGILAWIPAQATVAVAEWCARIEWSSGLAPSLDRSAVVVVYLLLAAAYVLASWRWPRWGPARGASLPGTV